MPDTEARISGEAGARFELLSAIVRSFAEATGDRDRLLARIVEATAEAFGGYCSLVELGPDAETVELIAAHDADPAHARRVREVVGRPIRVAREHPLAASLEDGSVYVAEEMDPDLFAARFTEPEVSAVMRALDIHALMFVPLRLRGRSVGGLGIGRHGPAAERFGPADRSFATSLADHAALAIDNAMSLREARRELAERRRIAERQRALVAASRELVAATGDVDRLLDTITRRIGGIFDALCALRLLGPDRAWFDASGSIHHPEPGGAERIRASMLAHPQRTDEGLSGETLRLGHALLVPTSDNASLVAQLEPRLRPMVENTGITSVMTAPLRALGETIGVLNVCALTPGRPFDHDDLVLLEELAAYSSLALHIARLIEESKRELVERSRTEQLLRVGFLEAAPDAVIIAGEDGIVTLVNSQAERLFGYARDEIVGQSIDVLVPESARRHHRAHRADFARAPTSRPMGLGLELHARRKDGSEFAAEISLSPIATPDGMLVAAAVRDVTERRRELDERNRRTEEANRIE